MDFGYGIDICISLFFCALTVVAFAYAKNAPTKIAAIVISLSAAISFALYSLGNLLSNRLAYQAGNFLWLVVIVAMYVSIFFVPIKSK